MQTERSVQAALNSLTKRRTVLVIAHRLTTISHAEQIIVLEAGEIVERGTHEQLLKKKGTYATLWHSRLEEAKKAEEEANTPKTATPATPKPDAQAASAGAGAGRTAPVLTAPPAKGHGHGHGR